MQERERLKKKVDDLTLEKDGCLKEIIDVSKSFVFIYSGVGPLGYSGPLNEKVKQLVHMVADKDGALNEMNRSL